MKKETKKENVYILIIILLIILNLSGFILFQQQIKAIQNQIVSLEKQVKKPTLSEIIIPEDSLIFRNKKGIKIAEIASSSNGGGFDLYTEKEKKMFSILPWRNGSILLFFNLFEKPIVSLGSSDEGGALFISDNQAKPMAGISSGLNGGTLILQDNNGHVTILDAYGHMSSIPK